MSQIKKIKGTTPDGKETEYDAILTFNNRRNDKDYIVYTDNTYDQDGKLKVFAALYDEDAKEPFLGYPLTQEEWQDIYELLDSVILNDK